ncbi:hypothetical protein [Actinomadura litoris]|uniref:hypothetical protein n=1 Tax=Actinomadura litoris TaxID=2678616 RepID=UPI001FA7DC36|nr:hypothetical protein [Actinomadura litoris]
MLRSGRHTWELRGWRLDAGRDTLGLLAVVRGLEALKRRTRAVVHCPQAREASKRSEGSGSASPDLLDRFTAQREGHEIVWASGAEPPEGGDGDRARELAARARDQGVRHAQAQRRRVERPSKDTIEEAVSAFLDEQDDRVSERVFDDYETVLELLLDSLDTEGHLALEGAELRRFEEEFERDEAGVFCRLFGPEKIPEHIGGFLGSVLAVEATTSRVRRVAGPLMRELAEWLAREYGLPGADVEDMLVSAEQATRDLPAADLLLKRWKALCADAPEPGSAQVQGTVRERLWVTKVQPGLITFWNPESDDDACDILTFTVPHQISNLVRIGWKIDTKAVLVDNQWRMIQIGTVCT